MTPSTIKLKKMSNEQVVVVVECGATCSFISQRLIENLNLALSKTRSYSVVKDSSKAIKGKRVLRAIVVSLPKMMTFDIFLPVELGHLDLDWECNGCINRG